MADKFGSAPPSYAQVIITEQPLAQPILDELVLQKLSAVRNYDIRQGNAILEALTDGAWPNTYIISDNDRHVVLTGSQQNETTPFPLYLVQEESDCCSRCCCPGLQSFVGRVHHASPEVRKGLAPCGCQRGHSYKSSPEAGVAFTLEREGCCSKCVGCFICCACCQNDMTLHGGNASVRPGMPPTTSPTYFGRSLVPIGGGGLVPTIHLFTTESQTPFAVVKGPTFYAGCLGICTDTVFHVHTAEGMGASKVEGDYIGTIVKPKPDSCGECCLQMCTSVDRYKFEAGPAFDGLNPQQRAVILGNIIHIEYMFFENDLPPVYCARSGNSTTIICTLCQMYCFGCCCPIQICIPLGGNN